MHTFVKVDANLQLGDRQQRTDMLNTPHDSLKSYREQPYKTAHFIKTSNLYNLPFRGVSYERCGGATLLN